MFYSCMFAVISVSSLAETGSVYYVTRFLAQINLLPEVPESLFKGAVR